MKFTAILFDFDGVIGKTMEDNYLAWMNAFELVDLSIERKEYYLLEGLNTYGVAQTVLERNNLSAELAQSVVDFKESYYLKNNHFELYPGVEAMIMDLHLRYKLALVTGAGLQRLLKTVASELLNKFHIIVSGDDIKNPKPHPQPYLLAAEALAISPDNCLVVENAPLGIESAKKAGMDCVAVCSTLPQKYLSQADYFVDNISSLQNFFSKLGS